MATFDDFMKLDIRVGTIIDVGGGAPITVTEPDLDLFHLYSPCKQERDAVMLQVLGS